MNHEDAKRAAAVAGGLPNETRTFAGHWAVLRRTAQALESSAALAEAHAQRREQDGLRDEAAKERVMAGRATDAARRARRRAEELLDLRSTHGR